MLLNNLLLRELYFVCLSLLHQKMTSKLLQPSEQITTNMMQVQYTELTGAPMTISLSSFQGIIMQ